MKIVLISDLHANIYALRAVLDKLENQGVDRILVAGDIVGYYFWPREVVQLLMGDERIHCIQGNHERILQECLSDEKRANLYRQKYGIGFDLCIEKLSTAEIDWLFGLPEFLKMEFDDFSFYLGHGSPSSADRYIYPDCPRAELLECFTDNTFTVLGHTHYPFLSMAEQRFLLNPGSVGQPRDIGGLASYAVVNLDNLTVKFDRVRFDKQAVIGASKKSNPELPYLWEIMDR